MSDERRTDRRPGPGRKPTRRRIAVPWWGLTLLGAGAGMLMASWPGLVLGGMLGFFAWKLR